MTRGLAAVAVSMAVSIAAPAVAGAAERYAKPGGDFVGPCATRDTACEIHHAVNDAGPNDEVIILTGDYGSATVPLMGSVSLDPDRA